MSTSKGNYRHRLKVVYGMTPEQYEALLQAQGGLCAICGEAGDGRRLSVDHDHGDETIRGLLCTACNFALGCFRDDIARLKAAIWYLEHPPAVGVLADALTLTGAVAEG